MRSLPWSYRLQPAESSPARSSQSRARQARPRRCCSSTRSSNPTQTQLLVFGHGVPNIPVLIYTASNLGIPEAQARAWGAAFVLLGLILIANIGARLALARYRARLGQ